MNNTKHSGPGSRKCDNLAWIVPVLARHNNIQGAIRDAGFGWPVCRVKITNMDGCLFTLHLGTSCLRTINERCPVPYSRSPVSSEPLLRILCPQQGTYRSSTQSRSLHCLACTTNYKSQDKTCRNCHQTQSHTIVPYPNPGFLMFLICRKFGKRLPTINHCPSR